MKLTTAIAGTLLMLTTSLTASFATDKNACGEERQLVTALYRQISAAEEELAAAKTNRNVSVISNTAMALIAGGVALSNSSLITEDPGAKKVYSVISATMASAALFNFHVAQSEISLLEEMLAKTKEQVEQREADIQNGLCYSDMAESSANRGVQETYKTLLLAKQKLESSIFALAKNIGNTARNGSTWVTVGGDLMAAVMFGVMKNPTISQSKHGYALAAGILVTSLSVIGTQALVNAPALYLSLNEARALLEQAQNAYERLEAQESLLKAIIYE
ncbi:MAG: hypothetical protein A2504_00610 [Bdellovibrionales bacterium RIFOXYD12_FULL_39_22]|nr:MAG: hypothetical protein A2385_03230 [Bdellovibrionales bacterium RIFOXYB1_FULL_39_21]OFZ42659.1 MAG: hypothetical protein A2485_10075 [Bdellovibrionales bacterium RIFOXYC12_FULL_39_17]OFZ47073.1 MAG: hypothetical protein A2404_15220 [Bdellovibrionales bacterium RIFOXYC1_FULL_39_130]OFZ71147.1 MAG: hypothetical protein A2451_02770 [Bdellovibrionales bacterium RIFOXYC2_FULL_39_8]OFZ75321.1 MAG: hypothetical protein A2560_13995 [Bdellovibrionales bacterium RIFOXYD1_FULL_39_84]OFZ93272.1 MAG: